MSIPGSASPLFFTAAADAAALTLEKSVRFNSGDSAYLNRTPSSAGSNTTWTLSTWVKKTGNDNHIFGAGAGNTPGRFGFGFNGSNEIFAFVIASGSTVFSITTDAVFRDPAAWYHIVLIADTTNSTQADRFKIYVNGVLQSVSGTLMPSSQNTFVNTTAAHTFGRRSYTASDYFNGYLASTILVDGTAKNVTDFGAFDDSGVWQAAAYSGSFGTNGFHLFDFANESGIGSDSSGNDNDFTVNNISQASLITWSDGWTDNLLSGFPGTNCFNGTGTGLTIGGSNVKSTWTAPSSIPFTTLSIRGAHDSANIKVNGTDVTSQFSSGLSVVTVTGISSPLTSIDLDNTNGLGNARISAIRIDGELLADDTPYPGAGNDVLRDVPTNGDSSDDTGAGGEVSGNYATLNPLSAIGGATISNGNLEGRIDGAATEALYGTIAMSSGKWYWEFLNTSAGAMHGIADLSYADNNWYDGTGGYCYYSGTGNKYQNSNVNSSYGDSYGIGDVIGVAFDADNGDLYFYKNGAAQNSGTAAFTGLSGTFAPIFQDGLGGGNVHTFAVNFGQRVFAYSAPSGYKPLCTTLLPTPTIADGSDYFAAKTYSGTGATQSITTGFSPGLVWIKNRGVANSHALFDIVRGAEERLRSDTTGAEQNQTGTLTSFDSDGFTIGTAVINDNGESLVAWAWNAGSSTVTNTDGDITSSVRASQTSGFSVVSYTGSGTSNDSVGHGLNTAPSLIILKNRDGAYSWRVLTTAIDGSLDRLFLDTTNTKADQTFDAPTSSVFSVGSNLDHNNSGDAIIAYCFAPVSQYSAFGVYTGNGSADGRFVWTGFRPALVLTKATGASENWAIFDNKREGYNPDNSRLYPNTSDVEATSATMDLLSNGFKLRRNTDLTNGSGKTYIYAAFSENAFSLNGGLAR